MHVDDLRHFTDQFNVLHATINSTFLNIKFQGQIFTFRFVQGQNNQIPIKTLATFSMLYITYINTLLHQNHFCCNLFEVYWYSDWTSNNLCHYLAPGGGCEVLFSPGLSVCVYVCVCVYLCVRPIFWYFISRLLEEISIWNAYRILMVVLDSLKKMTFIGQRLTSYHKNWAIEFFFIDTS